MLQYVPNYTWHDVDLIDRWWIKVLGIYNTNIYTAAFLPRMYARKNINNNKAVIDDVVILYLKYEANFRRVKPIKQFNSTEIISEVRPYKIFCIN